MASEAPEPDTFEWTSRAAAAHLQQADVSLSNAHGIQYERALTPEVQARALLSIAHSLFALTTMIHYAFTEDEGDG